MNGQRLQVWWAWMAIVLGLGMSVTPAMAVPKSWTGGGDKSSWADGNNWGGTAPQGGDDVSISIASTVILSSAFATLNSFTITNATLVFTNWTTTLNATTVTIRARSVLTLPPAFMTNQMSNCVHIVCTNFIMDAGSTIDASSRGYATNNGPGHGTVSGSRGSGGGYGGRGGMSDSAVAGGAPCGVTNAPLVPGSGNGGGNAGGKGGGVVWIEAGNVTINGTVDASGGSGAGYGAGSGGSVFIRATGSFGGTTSGLIRVTGGSGTGNGGGGGGGRIAVDYATLGIPHAVRFQASPGIGFWGLPDWWQRAAQMGTLWLSDTNLLAEYVGDALFTDVLLVSPGLTTWSPDSLTISNCSFGLLESSMTVANDLRVNGGSFSLGIGSSPTNLQVTCRNLYLTNGASLHIYSGKTNGVAQSYGALVSVAGDAIIGTSCWVYAYSHETDGGAPIFRMSNLVVGSKGGISGNNRGYAAEKGPGAGTTGPSGRGGGGAYGGRGGNSSVATVPGGVPYGSANGVLAPGSGGGNAAGAFGGGLIRVEATNLTLNGSLTAKGGVSANGGGSGGGISIACGTFSAAGGLIQAPGGDGTGNGGGGGGGGRIELQYSTLGAHDVLFSASSATGIVNSLSERTSGWQRVSSMGTLYLPEVSNWLSATMSGGVFSNVILTAPGFTNWGVASLTFSNTWLALGEPGFCLTVTNDVRIENALLELGCNSSTARPVLSCGGNLMLTNGGALTIYSGLTNALTPDYGALVSVVGDVTLGSSSWVYVYSHETNGGSALFRMHNLTIAETNAGFNANGRGYAAQNGPGKGTYGSANTGSSGGGHGGRGGRGSLAGVPGSPNGSTNAPVNSGSGGAYLGDAGRGGGGIRIEASGSVFTRGRMMANGASSWQFGGGGSGGSIFIDCRSFSGAIDASLQAIGGDGTTAQGGGGGGGRIAVWQGATPTVRSALINGQPVPAGVSIANTRFATYEGSVSTTNGTGWDTLNAPLTNALPGSVVFVNVTRTGLLISIY